jgi:hypothetical protein
VEIEIDEIIDSQNLNNFIEANAVGGMNCEDAPDKVNLKLIEENMIK